MERPDIPEDPAASGITALGVPDLCRGVTGCALVLAFDIFLTARLRTNSRPITDVGEM